MDQQTQNLIALGLHELNAGNYAKAQAFAESALSRSPAEFLSWIIKARCEAQLRTGDMGGWTSCHASLLQANTLAATGAQKQQTLDVWLQCFVEIMTALENKADAEIADGDENRRIATLAGAGAVLVGAEAFRAKGAIGRIAGAAGLVAGSVAAAHYSNAAKIARFNALQGQLYRCTICCDTLLYLESQRAILSGKFNATVSDVAGCLPKAMLAAATAAHSLDELPILKSLDVSDPVRFGARYTPDETRLAVAEWLKVLAHRQLSGQAVNLAAAYAVAVGRSVDLKMPAIEIERRTAAIAQSLIGCTLLPLVLFIAYWPLVAGAGQPKWMVLMSFVIYFVSGLYSAISIDRVLGDDYPRFNRSRRSAGAWLTAALTFGMYAGWYPWWRRRTWAKRAAINGAALEVLNGRLAALRPAFQNARLPLHANTTPTR